ncbi:MAG: phosphoenolpyruvate carboxykinase (GTP) [Chloroflexi bacterium]|nr:phosphoenolpyruvate carboxykinase (GTP) [Chloroflexota bacterium]
MTTSVEEWVDDVSRTTRPDRVVWCDGTDAENDRLIDQMVSDNTLIRLNEATLPNCFLHRSNPQDVARTEHLTFICSEHAEDAGPTNNWMSPEDAQERIWPLFNNSMHGRTMYVVPYLMGPAESPYAKVGVEVTDSPYVVANMRIMTRMGRVALDRLKAGTADWVPGLHSLGDLSPDRRFIAHFPETRTIWSVGSGYGGNALLGKKCYALRIASTMGREQGWLAEHMLILGLESPDGDVTYIAGAFPSACGKTNLAMLKSPFESEGWKVWTVGEDIAWINIGPDPLVYRSFDWEHGVFVGATMASETTAAATGAVGVVRRDPMAMLPFCGYNMGDYWAHWLEIGKRTANPPAIFQVNWFRTDAEGRYIWPGFGENMRVLRWVRDQVRSRNGSMDSRETAVGIVPTPEAIGTSDLGLSTTDADVLFTVDRDDWRREAEDQHAFLQKFGDRLPEAIRAQHQALQHRLSPVAV